MAFSFGFYNSIEHDRRYDAVQMSMIFDGIIGDGVYATVGKAFILRVNSQKRVVVQPGRAWFNHTWNYNDADLPLDTPQSDLVYPRWDAVVIDIKGDVYNRENKILWVKGTPSSNPKYPTMANSLEHHQYPLGYVYRRANTDAINQEDIENRVGSSECPFVTGILKTIDIDELLLQWKDQWAQFVAHYEKSAIEWFEAFKGKMSAYEGDFLDWFKNLRYVLNDDAGGHLQNEIDNVGRNEFNHYYGLVTTTTKINTSNPSKTVIEAQSSEDSRITEITNPNNNTTIIIETITPNIGHFKYKRTTTITKENDLTNIHETYERVAK